MRAFVRLLIALLLLALPLQAQDADDDGGGFLERLIEDNLSGAGRDVRIRGFAGALSSRATIEELTISDETGVWLTLRDAVLDWNRSALLRGRLEVSELTAGEILLPRLPGADPAAPSPEATPFSLPDLPVSILIEDVEAERVVLGEALFGAAAEVSLDGSLTLDGGTGAANLAITRIDGREGALTLEASYDNATEVLALNLEVTEAEDGIAANLLNLPGRPSVRLVVAGEGPLADFTADLALETAGEPRLSGTVELTASGEGDAVTRGFSANIGGDIAPVFAPRYRPFFGPDIRLIAEGARSADGGVVLDRFSLTADALTLEGRVEIGAHGLPDLIDVTGEIVAQDGSQVLLPVGGESTQVDRIGLNVQFDASQGEDWTGEITLSGLDLAALDAEQVVLDGSGRIASRDDGTRSVNAEFQFEATGLAAADPSVQQALGDSATGAAVIDWQTGAPVVLQELRLDGESFALDGSGQVSFGERLLASLTATLNAADLNAFSALAGRSLGGATAVEVELEAAPLDGSFDATVRGTATDLSVDQPQADALLAGITQLVLRADRDETGTRLSELTLENPAISLSASGDLKTTASSLRANLRLAEASVLDPALSGPLDVTAVARQAGGTWDYDLRGVGAGAEVQSSGTVTGLDDASPRITTDTQAVVEDLGRFSGLAQRDLAGSADLQIRGFALADLSEADVSIEAETAGLQLDDPRIDDLLTGRVELSARVQRDGPVATLERFLVDAPEAGLHAEGSLEVRGLLEAAPLVSGTIDFEANDLARFSTLAKRDLGGALSARVTGSARTDGSEADLSVEASGRSVRTGMASLDPLFEGVLDLSGRVQREGDVVTVSDLALSASAPGLRVTGSGRAEDLEGTPLVSLSAELSADDLSPLAGLAQRPLSGAIAASVSGTVRIDGSEADLEIDATGRDLRVGIAEVDPLLAGEVALAGQVRREGDTIAADDLRVTAEGPGLRLTGSGRVEDFTGSAPAAALDGTLAIDDLSAFSGLAGRPLAGAVDLTVGGTAKTDLSVLDAVVDGQVRNLEIGQENVDRLLRGVTELGLTARRDGEVIDLSRLRIVNPQITATADGRYDAGQSALRAEVEIADLADLDARMNGRARIDLLAEEEGEVWQVTLDGDAADATIDASLAVRDPFGGNPGLDGSASLRAADLSRFAPLANRPIAGSLTADISGNGLSDLSVFEIDATVQGTNLRTGIAQADRLLGASSDLRLIASRDGEERPIDVETFRLETAALRASAEGTVLGTDANLEVSARLADISPYVSGFNGPVSVEGSVRSSGDSLALDLSGTGPGGMTLRTDGTVAQDFGSANLSLDGRAPLGLVNPFIEPRLLEGTLAFDLNVNGPLQLSSVRGRISTSNARFVLPTLSTVLENIEMTGDLSNGTIRLNGQAQKQAGGRLSVSGPIALGGRFDTNLTVEAVGVVIEDPRLYRAVLSGRIGVDGPLAGGARIAGTLDIIEAEGRIPSTGLGATGPIPDGLVHVNEPAAVRATRARAGLIDEAGPGGGGGSGRRVAYPLDLTIRAENRIFLRGRGLDAELGGSLTLTGTTARVVPSGQFELIRGRLDLLGKRLTLDEGLVTLQGDFTPYIRLVARTDAGDVVVIIVVEGEALEPEIDFLSEPELPEEEVLARLLFGKSITSISPLQAAQLASSVATLAGRGGDGVIGNLRKGFGLDDLDFTTDAEGNAGLRAGKYLSENLYSDVTIESGGEATINLNLDLTPSLTIKGGASNSGETSLGIFFERDY